MALPKLTFTVAIAALGGVAAIPLGMIIAPPVVVGAAVGGLVDYLRRSRPVPPAPVVQAIMKIVPPHVQAATVIKAATKAAASPPSEATNLLNYLVTSNAKHVANFYRTPTATALIMGLQTRVNSDGAAMKVLKKVPVTGKFDPATASALAFYTHKSFPIDPQALADELLAGLGGGDGGGSGADASASATFDFSASAGT